ncbi:MAG: alpha/beta fold hydrolase [Micromonosporaceae bacterium]|nr:alpha/beta fold hydrolase [Micromonosporaceae bacterium]
MVRPALVVLLVLAVLLAMLWLVQRRLIYLPYPSGVPPVAEAIPGGSDVSLRTSDGLTLGAWLVPSRAGDRDLTVLIAPGNAGNRSLRAPLAQALAGAGFAVLLFDYRGYGGNPGSPTEAGLARDVRAARSYLVDVAGVPGDRIIYFGESLGAAVVTELATDLPPAGLVLRSPFTDLAAVGAVHYPFLPVRAMLWDRYRVAERMPRLRVPTAVVYGDADSVVPPRQSRQVADLAAGLVRATVVAGADHNDPALFDGPEVVAAVVAVADKIDPSGH